MEPQYFWKLDPDPHKREKLDPDPHQSEKPGSLDFDEEQYLDPNSRKGCSRGFRSAFILRVRMRVIVKVNLCICTAVPM
jgi:hypothetical protein